jgi:hypothetical protein
MPGRFDAAEMPRLDAFDDEFGLDPLAIQREQQRKTRVRFWTFVGVALGAGVVGAFALAWPTAGGRLRLDLQSAVVTPISPQTHEGSDEEIGSLRRQVEALKSRITELEDAKEQAAHTIAALEAEQQSRVSAPSAYWYSNPAELGLGIESRPEWGGDVRPLRLPPVRPASRGLSKRTLHRRAE